jgi:hypothetical protein
LVGMAFHRIHFLANETPSSKSLNHFMKIKIKMQALLDGFSFGRLPTAQGQ